MTPKPSILVERELLERAWEYIHVLMHGGYVSNHDADNCRDQLRALLTEEPKEEWYCSCGCSRGEHSAAGSAFQEESGRRHHDARRAWETERSELRAKVIEECARVAADTGLPSSEPLRFIIARKIRALVSKTDLQAQRCECLFKPDTIENAEQPLLHECQRHAEMRLMYNAELRAAAPAVHPDDSSGEGENK